MSPASQQLRKNRERKSIQMMPKDRNQVLERLAAGAPLEEVLSILVATTEEVRPEMLCSVLLLDKETKRLRHGAAPSLPDFYNDAIDGLEIGPGAGSCGAAAYTGERVIVEDVMTHPNWVPYRELAERAELRACWSEPIFSSTDEVLGTLAMYYREPRAPDQSDLVHIETAAYLAGIAIEWKLTRETLQESEEHYRDLFEQSPICIWEEDYSAVKNIIDGLRRRGVHNFRRYFREHPETLRKAIKAIRVIDINRATLQTYGATDKEAFVRKEGAQRVQDFNYYEQELSALAAGERRIETESVSKRVDDGSEFVVRTITHVPDTHMDTWSLVVSTEEDITERKNAEDALRESETWQKHAQQVAKVGHWVWYGPNINDWVRDCGKGNRPPLISDEVARIFGIARNQTFEGEIKQKWETHPDDLERCTETLERAERRQSSYDIEYRIVHPDGDVRTVHEIGEPLHDEVRHEPTWVGVVQDVSAQKRLEADLISSEYRYRDLFEQSPIGLWEEDYSAVKKIVDRLRRRGVRNFRRYFREHPETLRKAIKAIKLLNVNQATLDIYRVPNKEAFLGTANNFAQLATEVSFYEQELARLAEGATRLTIEHAVKALKGSDVLVRTITHIPAECEDTWSLVVSTEEDITERKQAEEALRESEARLAKAQRIAKVGNWIWDEQEDRESYCSGEGKRIFGVPHEWLSFNFEEFLAMVHPNDRERVETLMKKAQKNRTGYELDYKIVRPDGETRFIQEIAEVEFDDGGELVRTIGTVQDITERKQAEEALRESEARLNRAQQIAGIGNFEWDAKTNSVIYRSATICDIYGVTPEKAPRTFDETVEFMHPDDRERVRAAFTAATAAGEGYDVEYRIVRPDGEIRCIHEISRLVFDETGAIIRSAGTFQDITERMHTQAQLIQASKLATLGEMATGLAHELNQPLNVIRMAADNAIERITDGEIDAQYLLGKFERISAQTERAADIIDHMQIFGRKVDEKPEYVDPRETMKNALGLVEEQLRIQGLEVETDFPDHCRKVLGHSVQLEQVLVDIISNARDAIEANRGSPGDPRNISLIVEDTGLDDKIRLVVKDTGG
ncbi:MAG: PAS domain-containing protein, partial [Alphaproteobacteria bacterium]|nr:PAS domain-containing protein [Alphaproteobacteria bacterium]